MAYNYLNPYFTPNQNYNIYQPNNYQMAQPNISQQQQVQQQFQTQLQQPNIQQSQQQPQTQQTQYDRPIQDVRFVESGKDAEDYILLPNMRVMLIDRNNSIFYIKSADSLGVTTNEAYKFTKLIDKSVDNTSHEIDTKDFVKTQDLKGYITKDDLANFITKDDLKDFITKDDLKTIDNKVDRLQKQIINDMLKGDKENGK